MKKPRTGGTGEAVSANALDDALEAASQASANATESARLLRRVAEDGATADELGWIIMQTDNFARDCWEKTQSAIMALHTH